MEPTLTQYHKAILSYLARNKYGKKSSSQIYEEFLTPNLRKGQIKNILKDLIRCGYTKPIEMDKQMIAFLGEMSDKPMSVEGYKITELGRSQISSPGFNPQITNYSNISNSVIANNSPNTTQVVSYTSQPEDIRDAIDELDLAVSKKDSSAIKQAFGYIADKSVDVAIAITTGALMR